MNFKYIGKNHCGVDGYKHETAPLELHVEYRFNKIHRTLKYPMMNSVNVIDKDKIPEAMLAVAEILRKDVDAIERAAKESL